MHSWATISHYLDYKSQNAIPTHLRKEFYALNALFYLADSHFEQFFQSSQEAREITLEKSQSEEGISDEEINYDTVRTYLRQNYRDRRSGGPAEFSKIVDELVAADYQHISELETDLQRAEPAFKSYEVETKSYGHFYDVGVVRISLEMVNPKYLEVRRSIYAGNGIDYPAPYEKYRKLISP
jgi:hypothetical protein|tara:strand:+ start:917 stop:1462 length:546 start_codon:yes stop_codon:yes gene_type:complete